MSDPYNTDLNQRLASPRRQFLRHTLYGGLAFAGLPAFARAASPAQAHVVVVGAGFAGLTAAKYIRLWSQGQVAVTVVEPNPQFISCPLSNLVLAGNKTLDELSFSYQLSQQQHGLRWLKDSVTAIDMEHKQLTLSYGTLGYDKLILAPGVDFDYSRIPGMNAPVADIPHAWKAGKQTLQLRQQLQDMPDGGLFVMTIPKAPYRCPPGPYERACQVAQYFKQHKPRSKVVILDANPDIVSKKGLFMQSFKGLYDGIIDYRNNSELLQVDTARKTVKTDFDQVKADVLNVIPPQRAGAIAVAAGLNTVDQRWCEVDFVTYSSSIHADVHIIGDSISAGLPKSAHMATSQARVCAAAVVDLLAGRAPNPQPVFANTCYSFVDAEQAIHVANVYRYDASKKSMVAAEGGGVSAAASVQEGQFAQAWARNIWAETLT